MKKKEVFISPESLVWLVLDHYTEGKAQRRVRPEWLINPKTGRRLELDIYVPQWNLAVEVDGIHHRLKYQKEKDAIKRKECKDRGIRLFKIGVGKGWPSLGQQTGRLINYTHRYTDLGKPPSELARQVVRTSKHYGRVYQKNMSQQTWKMKDGYWRNAKARIFYEEQGERYNVAQLAQSAEAEANRRRIELRASQK